ncbi:MAG: C39 family peptidase [Lachnospiraceae bacterium]|nr:C39 family peptidase [Lachnospiraceae bacterium]
MSERRTQEEELEYRRYLHRLKRREERRRKVMIARAVTVVVLVVIVALLTCLIRWSVKAVTGDKDKAKQPSPTTATISEPTLEPLDYAIPEGYEELSQGLEALREDYPEVEDILLNLYEYPENLLNLAINNQETLDFVIGYPKHKSDIKPAGKITKKELESGIPCLQQWDERWGYLNYGNDIIAIDGCGPTCLSMVVSGLLQDKTKTPDAMADFSIDNNYYTPASGSAWSLMSSGAEKQGLQAETVTVGAAQIEEQLQEGHPIICSMKPGDFTTTGHFIVLTGLTEEGKVTVNDPNSIARSQQEWEIDTLVEQMKAAWAYSVS